ncbi:MAG: hypothetical protein GQ563_04080 [Desulfuromusa sp.]|nr:hypothetical protein [Desulfuromusa sp.]
MFVKDESTREITALVKAFGNQHLDNELTSYALKLCDTLSRKRKLNIARGKREIWAAAIIYVIARMNFLFDKASSCFITTEIICEHFGTKKTSSSNKASLIEKACDFGIAEPGYCTREISESLSFVQLPNGMIMHKYMFEELSIEVATEEESRKTEKFQAEKRRQVEADHKAKKERCAEINRISAAEKKRKKEEMERLNQPNLFGD